MTYRIEFHKRARNEMRQIGQSLADIAGPASPRKIMAEIQQVVDGLKVTPHKGSLRDSPLSGLRSVPASDKAVISFVVNDDNQTVKIYAVTYAGQDWMGRVRSRL